MLKLCPITLKEANNFVRQHHRHSKPVVGYKFAIAVYKKTSDQPPVICGVLIAGRPVARYLDNGSTIEVNRCCSDGTRNSISKLCGAAKKTAAWLGYNKIITYTRQHECGSSLKASAWNYDGLYGGSPWVSGKKYKKPTKKVQKKHRWSNELTAHWAVVAGNHIQWQVVNKKQAKALAKTHTALKDINYNDFQIKCAAYIDNSGSHLVALCLFNKNMLNNWTLDCLIITTTDDQAYQKPTITYAKRLAQLLGYARINILLPQSNDYMIFDLKPIEHPRPLYLDNRGNQPQLF